MTGWSHAIEAFLNVKGIEFTAKVRSCFSIIGNLAQVNVIVGRPTEKIFERTQVVRRVRKCGLPSRSTDNRRRPLDFVAFCADEVSPSPHTTGERSILAQTRRNAADKCTRVPRATASYATGPYGAVPCARANARGGVCVVVPSPALSHLLWKNFLAGRREVCSDRLR